MNLFFRQLGMGEPLIILHGLYGSSDNWLTIGRDLAKDYTVYLVDQRNHGNSPHHPNHNYAVLSEDLYQFIQVHRLRKPIIMGHSMGGKTALAFGLKYPEQVKSMIVVDMSPLGYNHLHNSSGALQHERIINALLKMDIDQITSREDADQQLQPSIKSKAVRQFLLKNLKRTPDGKFRWALNLQALTGNLNLIFAGVLEENEINPVNIPEFPLLFIKGELSDYIGSRDEHAIHQYFPWAELAVIPGSGHWVHAEQPTSFLKTVRGFILHQ